MSKPVMTDEQIRGTFIKDLENKARTFRVNATKERAWSERITFDDEDRATHLRYAEHFDRCVAHYQQVIDLLKDAPMPEAQ